jgi:hypothetical protein
MPHLKHVKPRATPTVVKQGVTYPQGTWLTRSIPRPSERSQVLHHRPILGGNQGVGTITYSIVNRWDTCLNIVHLLMIN